MPRWSDPTQADPCATATRCSTATRRFQPTSTSVLGFRQIDPEGGDYIGVVRDDLHVGCSKHPDAPTTPRKPPVGSEVVLRVEDVEAELDRVRAAGWPIEDDLVARPWGMTDFRIFDPTGQYLRITGPA